ncbi:MAG: pyrroline-5-carboxylate reductase [Pseudomonadota bacterium]
MMQKNITFVGIGNMAASLIGGLIQNGHTPSLIHASDIDNQRCQLLEDRLGIKTYQDNLAAIENADVVIICVKPNHVKQVLLELKSSLSRDKPLILSIAAGVPIAKIQTTLATDIPIIRCMPNTPALVSSGASALCANKLVTEAQKALAESILRAVGLTVWLEDESLMDVVTALSGSGPAYFFLVMECLQNAAVKSGLDAKVARVLTLQTALGAAKMALESEHDVAELRRQVTSPQGTTAAAVDVLIQNDLDKIFLQAIESAIQRGRELAKLV